MRRRGRIEKQVLSGLWLVIGIQLALLLLSLATSGCALLPRERGLVLLEDCREEPGVELTCRVAPRGFDRAAFTLVIPYEIKDDANTIKGLRAENQKQKRTARNARRMKELRPHDRFGAELAPLRPGDDPGRKEATNIRRKRIL